MKKKKFIMKDEKEERLVDIRKVLIKNKDSYMHRERGGAKRTKANKK